MCSTAAIRVGIVTWPIRPLFWFKPATHLAILYADCRDRCIKSPVSGMSDIGDYIRRHSPSVPLPAIFYAHHCESPVKSINQVGQFYRNDFSKLPHRRDRRKKSPRVSAIIGGENRLRSNLPRSANKIARCVASFTHAKNKSFKFVLDELYSIFGYTVQ